MKKLIAIALLQFACFCSFAQNISIQVNAPNNNTAFRDSIVPIDVNITADYELATVIASFNGLHDTLAPENQAEFYGSLNIASALEGDTSHFILTVTDVFNNQRSDTIGFIYAPLPSPPVLNIIAIPVGNSNIQDSFHVNATVSGTGKCSIQVHYNFGNNSFTYQFGASVDTTFSVKGLEGAGSLSINGTDSAGQTVSKEIAFFIDSNLLLTPVFTGNGYTYISDFNYNKIMSGGLIIDIKTNVTDTTSLGGGFLTPYGAIASWTTMDGDDWIINTAEWNNGNYIFLGTGSVPLYEAYSINALHTAGKYATWAGSNPNPDYGLVLYERDLSKGTNITVGTDEVSALDNDVAANGVVVADNQYGSAIHPITDGYYSVYIGAGGVTLSTADSTITLGTINGYIPSADFWEAPETDTIYQLNNGYVAYNVPDNSGQDQIWLRDSVGHYTQLTFWGPGQTTATLESLDSSGDVMYDCKGERYYVVKGNPKPKDVGAAMGKLYYRDSTWYVAEGRYLYKFLVNAFVSQKDGDWNDPSTWNNGMVPPANADVIVENNVTVSTNETCNSLKIVSLGNVTVETGVNLTVLH
jgi:hypothetical protein